MPRAPRKCPHPHCENRITNSRYCAEHTQHHWGKGSPRDAADRAWSRTVRRRDKTCQLQLPGCTGNADEADHIINIKRGGARLDPNNGQGTCTNCHKKKTQAEATAARKHKATRLNN